MKIEPKDMNIKGLEAHPTVSHNWEFKKESGLYFCNRPNCNVRGKGFYNMDNKFVIAQILTHKEFNNL